MARRPGGSGGPGFTVVAKFNDQFTKPVKGINGLMAQTTAKIRDMGQRARAAFTNPTVALQNFSAGLGGVGRGFLNLRNSIAGFLGPFARMGTIVGGIGLATFTTDLVQTGAELVKTSQQAGVTVEQLQEMRYAAKQSGIASEEMDGALRMLNKTMRQAAAGDKAATKAMNTLGVSRKELLDGSISTHEVMMRLSNAVGDQTTELQKNTIASAFLGRNGAALIPLLNEQRRGFAANAEEARKAGIMTTEVAQRAKVFDDTMTTFFQHLKGVGLSAFEALLPSMQEIANSMNEWIKANHEWLKQEVVATITNIASGLKSLALVVKDAVAALKVLTPVWDFLTETFGKGNVILAAFAAVVAPGIIGAIIGIGKALALLVFGNPIGLFVAAIGAAGYLVWKYWEDIVAAFDWAVDQVVQFGERWKGYLTAFWDILPAGVQDTISAIAGLASSFADMVWSLFTAPFKLVRAWWNGQPEEFGQIIQDLIGKIGTYLADFENVLLMPFEAGWQLVKSLWAAMPDDIKGFIIDIIGAIKSMAGRLWDAITGVFAGPINWVKEQFGALTSWIPGMGGGAKPDVSAPGVTATKPVELATPGDTAADPRSWWQRNAPAFAGGQTASGVAALGAAQAQKSEAKIDVNIKGLPPGSTVSERHTGGADISMNASYAGTPAVAGAV